ncbi:MAG: zinc metalloprotease HtpX [Archangium sp.]|nr:zinc metalloprotease HtpX [Archangium sp.]MDP3568984.1 zinc metalloprotease HtpX [Archangium sp.]
METTLGRPVTHHRTSNILKTTVLLAAMSALTLGVGQVIGGPRGLLWAGVFVVVMNFASFWFSDRLALMMNRAQPLPPGELPWLEAMTADLARRAGLPMPRLYLVDSPTPNAFATGRSPAKAAVAVTTGLLNLLGKRELAGVIAHELSHVKNRDTLIMTVAATLAGVITHVAQMIFFWGGALFHRGDDEDEGGSLLSTLGVLIVAPIAATLLQLAISRAREFDADASAVGVTGDPEGLASALSKLESGNRALPLDHSPATAHLFIVNPLSGRGVMGLFATHPSIEDRIQRLLQMR